MRDEAAVAARASAVGEVLAGRVDELTDDIQAVIVELIPDLRDAGTDVLREFVRASMKNAVHALETREDAAEATAPASALEYAQALAQVDVAPTALIRAYRVGHVKHRHMPPVLEHNCGATFQPELACAACGEPVERGSLVRRDD